MNNFYKQDPYYVADKNTPSRSCSQNVLTYWYNIWLLSKRAMIKKSNLSGLWDDLLLSYFTCETSNITCKPTIFWLWFSLVFADVLHLVWSNIYSCFNSGLLVYNCCFEFELFELWLNWIFTGVLALLLVICSLVF